MVLSPKFLILWHTKLTLMHEELRKKAEEKVKAKMIFYTTSVVFAGTAVVLFIIMLAIPPIAFWLLIPFPALAMVLGVMYLSAFGYPGTNAEAEDWEEEEVEKEMEKLLLRRKQKQTTVTLDSDAEALELKELERVEQLPNEEDLV